MRMIVDECNHCGKRVVKKHHSDSSDMVITTECIFYLTDVKVGEDVRPFLNLKYNDGDTLGHCYCLDCLVIVVTSWVGEMKERGHSNIPSENIIPNNRYLGL